MYIVGNRYKIIDKDEIYPNNLYKAQDTFCNNLVLINIIEDNNYVNKNFLENLIDEMTHLKSLKFPGILEIIDVGVFKTEKTYYYIVSPYYNGITLEKMIKENLLNRKYIIKIFNKILKTFEFAENNNIYHGSLNPKLIMIDSNFDVKIANFGIVKANNGINIRNKDTKVYLSPSQICINYTDIQSDFYSLGIILFESLFNKLPYKVYDEDEKMLNLIDKGIDYSKFNSNESNKDMIDIINKLLARKDKYQNVKEIIVDITGLMYDEVNINNVDMVIQKEVEVVRKKRKKYKYKNKIIAIIIIILVIISSFFAVFQ